MLIANTPKERRLRVADVPWFPPIFLLSSPEFTISKRYEPCHGVSLASFLSSPEEENQKATAAGKLARALATSSARARLLLLLPALLPFTKSEELEKRKARVTEQGTGRVREARGRGLPGSTARPPAPGGGKATSRAHRPAPSAPLPAAGTRHILPGSARRGPNA